jgi:hypothetical protein
MDSSYFTQINSLARLPKVALITVIALSALVSFWISKTVFPIYEAHAKLSIAATRANPKETLYSRAILLQTLYALQSHQKLPKKVTLEDLKRNLHIKKMPDSTTYLLSFRYPESGSAATLLNTIALTYINHDRFTQRQHHAQQRELTQKKLELQQKLLQKFESELNQHRQAKAPKSQLLSLARQTQTIAQNYEKTLTEYQNLGSRFETEKTITLIESATPPTTYSYPYKVWVFMLSFLFSSGLGLAGLWLWKRPDYYLPPSESQPWLSETLAPKSENKRVEPSSETPLNPPINHQEPPHLPAEADITPSFVSEEHSEPSIQIPEMTIADSLETFVPVKEAIPSPPSSSLSTNTLYSSSPQDIFQQTLAPMLGSHSQSPHRLSLLVLDSYSNTKSQILVANWAKALAGPHQKLALVTFQNNAIWKSYFNRNYPPKTLSDYVKNAPIQSIYQETETLNLHWIPAEEFTFGALTPRALHVLDRRLKLHYDTVIYDIAPASLTASSLEHYSGLGDGWVLLGSLPAELSSEKELWGNIEIG